MASKATSKTPSAPASEPLTKQDIGQLQKMLSRMRDELTGQIATLKNDAVDGKDTVNWEEEGTDAFDREFAFKMAGSKNEMLKQIEQALRKIDESAYGICEVCNATIGRARIKVLPFCATCIHCQSKSEQGRVPSRVRLP